MGCGKTYVTAHIIEELTYRKKHQLPCPLICYHYCKNDETGDAVYIYSSLILQLLDQQEGFKVDFMKWYEDTLKSQHLDLAQSPADLGNFFSTCVKILERQLFIVIDGLDECGEESRTDLVNLLGDLSRQTSKLKVFLSSRPQESIENLLHNATQIRWRPSQDRDTIIVDHIVTRYLGDRSSAVRSLVSDRLTELARGNAIWVKLTVELLQKQKKQAVGPVKTFLKNITPPAALSELYAKLFSGVTDNDRENERLVTKALEVLAVARRPLSILELGWVVALNESDLDVQTIDELEDYVDEKRILSLLQPFISLVDFKDVKTSQVRLVHQSLKELILQDIPTYWAIPNTAAEASLNMIHNRQQRHAELEAALLRLCVRYLLFEDFNSKDLFSEEQATAQTLEELPGFGTYDDSDGEEQQASLGQGQDSEDNHEIQHIHYDPSERGFGEFFVYASCFWLDHFKVAESRLLPPVSDIVTLSSANSRRLRNWIQQNSRPDCTITPKFIYDSNTLDPLTITALYGPDLYFRKLLEGHNASDTSFLKDSVQETIQQILRSGDIARVCLLFRDSFVGSQVRTLNFFQQIMYKWSQSDKMASSWTSLFDLVRDVFDDLVQNKWGNELLCASTTLGCLPMVKRLFEGAAVNSKLKEELLRDVRRDRIPPDHHQSVGEAVWSNHVDVLRFLLEQEGIEPHLRHRDSGGYNVLHEAARCCNPEVVALLIARFEEGVHQINNADDTPLNQVVFESSSTKGRLEVARLLLTLGGANARGYRSRDPSDAFEPLRMAARVGDTEMCRLLVEVGGVDPRRALRKGDDGRPTLIGGIDCGSGVQYLELGAAVVEVLCSLAKIDPQSHYIEPKLYSDRLTGPSTSAKTSSSWTGSTHPDQQKD